MKKFFYRITFYTNSMMRERVMSYIYLKRFTPEVTKGGQVYWSCFYEDLYKLAIADLNKNHNPGKLIFTSKIERIDISDIIKSLFDAKSKIISPSI